MSGLLELEDTSERMESPTHFQVGRGRPRREGEPIGRGGSQSPIVNRSVLASWSTSGNSPSAPKLLHPQLRSTCPQDCQEMRQCLSKSPVNKKASYLSVEMAQELFLGSLWSSSNDKTGNQSLGRSAQAAFQERGWQPRPGGPGGMGQTGSCGYGAARSGCSHVETWVPAEIRKKPGRSGY